jgi:hypothetical protein
VISPNPRNHYLNITPANIVFIYSKNGDSCKQTTTRDTRLSVVLEEVEREESRDRHHVNQSGALKTPNRDSTQGQRFLGRTLQFGRNPSTPNNPHRMPQLDMSSTPQYSQFNRTPQFGVSSTPRFSQLNKTPQFAMSSTPTNSQVTRSSQLGRPPNLSTPQREDRMTAFSGRTPQSDYIPGNRAADTPHRMQDVRTPGASTGCQTAAHRTQDVRTPAGYQRAGTTPVCQTPNKNIHRTHSTPSHVSTNTSLPPKSPHPHPQVIHMPNQRSGSTCSNQTNLYLPSTGGARSNVPVPNETSNFNKSSPSDQKERFENELTSNQQSTPGRRSFKFKPTKTQVQTLSSNTATSRTQVQTLSSSNAKLDSRTSSIAHIQFQLTSANQKHNNSISISNSSNKPKFEVDSLWGEGKVFLHIFCRFLLP